MPFVLKDNATIYFKDERQIDIKTAYVRNDSLFSNNVGTEQFIGKRDSLDKIVVSSHKKGMGGWGVYGAAIGAGVGLYKGLTTDAFVPPLYVFAGIVAYGPIGAVVGLIVGHDTIYVFEPKDSVSENN